MKIAVSGTHGVGKSTLIEEFLHLHPEFQHEPEPYEVLSEDYGEEFAAEPCEEDFLRQLEFNIKRMNERSAEVNVIFERCPLDFLAYLRAFGSNISADQISEAVQQLDLIVYLPLDHKTNDGEYPKLRKAVDSKLSEILSETNVTVVEAPGSTTQRLRIIENALMNIKHTAG